jgi:hypothetical protein
MTVLETLAASKELLEEAASRQTAGDRSTVLIRLSDDYWLAAETWREAANLVRLAIDVEGEPA